MQHSPRTPLHYKTHAYKTITISTIRMLSLLLLAAPGLTAALCASASDCGLNGDCLTDGTCACEPAWTGSSCTELNLVPMSRDEVERGAYRRDTSTSWGGVPVFSEDDNLWHLYLAEMADNCTLTAWIPQSTITHAVSTSPEGPYTYKDTAFPTFHHNPTTVIF